MLDIALSVLVIALIYLAYGYSQEWRIARTIQRNEEYLENSSQYAKEAEGIENVQLEEFTLAELKPFNGEKSEKNPECKIYIAISNKIFDVTSGRSFYGSDGPYTCYAGRDASRSLASGELLSIESNKVQEWDDLSNLSKKEQSVLDNWLNFFQGKYPQVGTLLRDK